jgi:predicted transposase/invertase (TIGR01784 family)
MFITAIDQWKEDLLQEGEQRGMEKGMRETAQKMLKAGSDIQFISKVTGLSKTQLLKLKQKSH